ncbi:MAG TPA: MATE family efflux transporter [Bacteroidales bacterium]|nr:MATE family efflux transporter [Bacteroidales bacterium]
MIKTSISYKEIWKIAYPIILGSIVQNIISVTDTAFLGRVGEVELGAAAIGSVFYLTLVMLGFGFSIGTQIIVARRFGENKHNEIGTIIEHSHYFLVFLAIILVVAMKSIMPIIFNNVLESDQIREASKEYLNYRIIGLLFACVNFGFRAFYIGIARTKVITWTTILMALTNVFLDYVLIFGNMGFPKYGIAGAAIASVIAEIAACIFFIFYTLKFVDTKYFGLFQFRKFSYPLLKRILTVAFPMMMQNFISFIGWFFFFLFVEKMGEHSLAISNVIRSIYVVMLIPIWGFTSATNSLISFVIGRERTDEVIPLVLKILKLCLAGVMVLVLINIAIPEKVISIYTNNSVLIQDSLPSLYVVSIAAIFLTIGFVLFSGVSGTGMTKISFAIETIVIFMYVLVTYLLVNIKNSSVEIVWCVEIFYGFIIGLLSFLFLKYGKWKHKRI